MSGQPPYPPGGPPPHAPAPGAPSQQSGPHPQMPANVPAPPPSQRQTGGHVAPHRPPQETVPLMGPQGTPPLGTPPPQPPPSGPHLTMPSGPTTHPAMQAVQGPAAQGPMSGAATQGPMSGRPPLGPSSVGRLTVRYPQPGTVLRSKQGEYLVQRVMGAGQFGAVYDCVGPFDQAYAVKVIRPANRPYHEVQAEWTRETQRLFSLRHPNIVYLYDFFEQEHLFYQALERCDHALGEMLGAPMQEGLVIELARQLLAAVQFLHDADIVHDDLHPGNVLVSHTDRPTLKISDFGISAELRGAPAIRPDVVHHKIMAPEILATGYTSKQSDLYQIGLLLYWMITGGPAIPQNLPYPDLVRFVSEGEPRRRAELIGTPLGHLIAKMLRRRETFRYTSAREVWADMRMLAAWQNRQLFPVK